MTFERVRRSLIFQEGNIDAQIEELQHTASTISQKLDELREHRQEILAVLDTLSEPLEGSQS